MMFGNELNRANLKIAKNDSSVAVWDKDYK